MRDILKRIFIGVAIGMALFFLKTEVFALSWDMFPQEDVFVFNSSPIAVIINTSNSSTTQTVQRVNFHNNFKNTQGYDLAVFVYSLSEESQILYNQSSTAQMVTNADIGVKLISDGSWSTCQLQDSLIVCPIKKDLTYSALQFYVTKSFANIYVSMNLTNSMTYYKSVGQHTANLLQTITQQNDEIINGDSPASATYNNDYSTNDYDTAESNIDNHLDTDVSNFIFNPAQWINAFNWIWQTLTSFVQVNGKVFATITSFLTLSFVGLVIGRT